VQSKRAARFDCGKVPPVHKEFILILFEGRQQVNNACSWIISLLLDIRVQKHLQLSKSHGETEGDVTVTKHRVMTT